MIFLIQEDHLRIENFFSFPYLLNKISLYFKKLGTSYDYARKQKTYDKIYEYLNFKKKRD